jgi:hypothetical protein
MKIDRALVGALLAALLLGLSGSFLQDMGGYKNTAAVLNVGSCVALAIGGFHFWFGDL